MYALPAATPIVTPASAADDHSRHSDDDHAPRANAVPLTVRIHDTPYWVADGGCVATGTGQTTTVVPNAAGTVVLRFAIRPGSILRALTGGTTTCPAPAGN